MFIGVCAKVMSVVFQLAYVWRKGSIAVEIACEKESGFYVLLPQCMDDVRQSFAKLMSGKYQRKLLKGRISADDGAFIAAVASLFGGRYFFGIACASIAASR